MDDRDETRIIAEGKGAEVGVFVYGVNLEGARWDSTEHSISDSRPKELYFKMWPLHLIPEIDRKLPPGCYECPLYKSLARRGVLSTTGHSTNFVCFMSLPSNVDPDKWVLAGVA